MDVQRILGPTSGERETFDFIGRHLGPPFALVTCVSLHLGRPLSHIPQGAEDFRVGICYDGCEPHYNLLFASDRRKPCLPRRPAGRTWEVSSS